MSNFWEKQLNGSAPPPHVQQPVARAGAWWMTPAQVPAQPHTPPQQNPGLDSGRLSYAELKHMRADDMSQEQMEALALLELQEQKYNNACPNCGSDDFLPAGTKIGTQKMPTDKCFHCGSSGAITGSPEPAHGGGSGKPGRATRQLAGHGSYGQHHTQLPQQFLPRGGS